MRTKLKLMHEKIYFTHHQKQEMEGYQKQEMEGYPFMTSTDTKGRGSDGGQKE